MSFRSAFLASLLVLPFSVCSYKIDQSCNRKGVDGLVRDAMTNAFSMADSALRRLNQDPYDPHTEDLITHLFLPKNGQDPKDRDKMSKVKRILEEVNKSYRLETTGELGSKDAIIYCDGSRYEDRGKRDGLFRKLYYDTSTNTHVLYKKQSCHEGLTDFPTLAVTYNPEWESEDIEDKPPTQIQLCPWFVDWIKNKEYKLHNDVIRSNFGRYVIKKAEANQGLKQIDAFSLLDKVLLHEMTHGRSAWEGEMRINGEWKTFEGTADLPVPGTALIPFPPLSWLFPVRPAYGWKWARDLALRGPDTSGLHPWNPEAPDHNADSIAMFGSAAKLLDDPEKPRRVLEDGRIEIIS
ncbi:hypothetical protein HBI56_053270 [Parastagonospora nodorum]|nr:hypothetical protein HBH53_182780 [Parastagonospora nodorum]KAH3964511.1 hypothetical protein HBH51_158880 [Parastagonospora nodorum]KAH3981306.1 hypothetical protein HBH52_086740 [Parastagonospora nodorum]KAH4003183.1 hypothetical protein HBI10_066260 [Parastagonospora nodorum]KAH4022717.1 hypothetical protein HBI09_166750 [Parastagonospora nodorum]